MRRAALGIVAAIVAGCSAPAVGVDAGSDAGSAWIEEPPIEPEVRLVGSPYAFVGVEACFDLVVLGELLSPVTMTWGDGDTETLPPGASRACHAWAFPGPLVIGATWDARFGRGDATQLVQVVFEPETPRPTASSTIVYDGARDRVWVVEPDAGVVTVIDAIRRSRLRTVPVCDRPRTVAVAGERALVACQGGDVQVLDAGTMEPLGAIALGAGSAPFGVIADPRGDGAWVTLQTSGELASLDPVARTVRARIAVGPDPRAIAMRGDGTISVTRWRSDLESARVYAIDGRDRTAPVLVGATRLPRDETRDTDTDNKGVLNFLSTLAPSPDGGRVIATALKANVVSGTFRTGEPLTAQTTARAALGEIALAGPAAIGIDSFRHRFDDLDMASAATFSPMGERLYVAILGAEVVVALDAFGFDAIGSIDDVGHAPDGLVTSPDGEHLFVHAALSRVVRVYDVRSLSIPPVPIDDVATVEAEPLDAQVLAGAIVFHGARDARMSRTRYLSCASCHLDGEADGLTWDFTQRGEGLRNTIPLRGRSEHGPIHWSGNFDEVQDFEHDIRDGQGGTGFLPDALFHAGTRDTTLGDPKAGLSAELDALAAYVASLDAIGTSPHRRDGDPAWEAARARGESLFASAGCAGCHAGARFTDSAFTSPGEPRLHDVGTLGAGSGARLGGALTGLDTPTLRALWASAPYLHDGSAPTLRAVLRDRNPDDRHGTTSTLTDAQLADLETYLLSIE